MSGAFSTHLLNTHNSAQPSTPNIITSGAMSFDARMHGTPGPSQTPFFASSSMPHSFFGFTPLADDSATAKNIATLQAKLNKKLGPEYISQRPGPGGPKLTYAEGWKIINLANEVFGFNGWSSSIVNIGTDFVDYSEESKKFNVGVSAIVRVTLRDGVYHEDVGYGMLENAKSKAAALDKCKKEAVTDALKRTLRNFGNLLGNCLYDKSYAQEIVKIKVPPAKFDKNELYRRPEFEERVLDAPPLVTQISGPSSTIRQEHGIKVEPESHHPETPITYVPRHLRQEIAAAAQQAQIHKTPARSNTPSGSGSCKNEASNGRSLVGASKSNGLATPIQTPILSRAPLSKAPRQVATSPLARVRSAPERNVSFADPEPAQAQIPACAHPVDTEDQEMDNPGQASGRDADEDDDPFPLSTQEGAFFATVDLGEGDSGRPIDFDEGLSSVDGFVLEEGPELPAQPSSLHHQLQLLVRTVSGSSAGPSSVGPSETGMGREALVQPVVKPSSGCGQRQPRIGSSSVTTPTSLQSASGPPAMPSAQDNKRAMTASMGGFQLPPSTKPLVQQFTTKPVTAAACARMPANIPQSGTTTNSLKRNVEVMQAGSGPSRPPIQGMGLAQRQEQEQQQNTSARRSLDNGEATDLKRVKR